jgi:hypothetical protein
MGAASYHWGVEEVLADLTAQRRLERRKGGERSGQPVCAVRNGGRDGIQGWHGDRCHERRREEDVRESSYGYRQ